MKILFDHSIPFLMSHGGFQIQIEQTKGALEQIGIAVEYLRWWDPSQTGDLIHFFGRPPSLYVEQAHNKHMKVVVSELLTAPGSRSYFQRSLQRALIAMSKGLLPASLTARLAWDSLLLADACVALTSWEAALFTQLFAVPPSSVHVVPNGVEDAFFLTQPQTRDKWLVCTSTITPRKRVLETARAAIAVQVPLWIIGKPYSEAERYAEDFRVLCHKHPDVIRYEGAISDRKRLALIYRQARGFVLLSTMESLSLSALEAAACGCPLLLSDLPWAHATFGENAHYCPVTANREKTARHLREFYEQAPDLPAPPPPKTWHDVAQTLRVLYQSLL
jgi:glycosyltransferase involved in cell wall biosynthesis